MYVPILAHFGHWYISLPTFMGPVVIIVIALKVSAWRERRAARGHGGSSSRVALTQEQEDQAVVTVTGPLDYPALLDIEYELGVAVACAPDVLLDLSSVSSVTPDFAWNIPEIISKVDHRAEIVAVAIGTAPAAEPLRKVCELEGVRVVEQEAATET